MTMKITKPYLIGEIGINHNGDIKIAKQLLEAGKKLFVVDLDDKDPADMGFSLFTNKIQKSQEFTFSSLFNLKLNI